MKEEKSDTDLVGVGLWVDHRLHAHTEYSLGEGRREEKGGEREGGREREIRSENLPNMEEKAQTQKS